MAARRKASRKKTAKKRARKSAGKSGRAKKAARKSSRRAPEGVDLADVRAAAMGLPGAEEGTSYGTPAWRVRGKLFARVHDSGESLVVRIDLDERELAMASDPETYFITDHYRDHPFMLVRLATTTPSALAEAILGSWLRVAPSRLRAEHEGG